MRTSWLFVIAFGILLNFHSADCIAQTQPKMSSVQKYENNNAKEVASNFSQYELSWKAIETHRTVDLKISGHGTIVVKKFENGEAPYFNAFEEGLAPGVYNYTVEFTPNNISEDHCVLQDLILERRNLLKLRREKMEAGDRKAVQQLIQQANAIREKALELNDELMIEDASSYLTQSGKLIVNDNGEIKRFDLQKSLEESAAKQALEKQEQRSNSERDAKFDRDF